MASKSSASLALFFSLNLLFFALVTACGTCPSPNPKPKPRPKPSPTPSQASCPRDALKLGGLADLEAAVCLCTAIKANILGINLNIPLSLSLLLNVCSKNVPSGFKCA
ncbi:hypothetical protein CIPAW_12G108300 [Carya illinoinensis]|uniref:Hydrophobic seed protein domain-containing protein n=1 Tax=Carya illinoinensis TaxID=32201 RepID=A0A8T1NY97_CARIL|nr:hypothetical protein CIPAW_12G108300 [Carya illinoinensis]